MKAHIQTTLVYVFQAITQTRVALSGRCPLIGFSGAPWTLMVYMIEGNGKNKNFNQARQWFYQFPQAAEKLLKILTETIIEYCVLQVEAGAQMLEIFDSWASDLARKSLTD